MGFEDIVRSGVATLDALTKSMQAGVTHEAWIGQSGDGVDQFASPVTRQAFVDRTRKQVWTNGRLITTVATLTFTSPIPNTSANPNQQRVNPVDPRDVFTLDDGTTAPIVKISGFEDAGVQAPYVNEVTLGIV